jgi:hypothetical protein
MFGPISPRLPQRLVFVLLALASSLSGCANSRTLLRRFSADTGCREGGSVQGVGAGAYRVSGCGTVREYLCLRDGWGRFRLCRAGDQEATMLASRSPEPASSGSANGGAAGTGVSRRVHADGYALLEAGIGGSTRVRVVAAPSRDQERVYLSFIRDNSTKAFPPGCEVKFVADGAAVDMPAAKSESQGRRQELGLQLPVASLAQIAKAQRVVGLLCGNRFELSQQGVGVLRELVVRFQEELVLAGETGSSEGKPSGSTAL